MLELNREIAEREAAGIPEDESRFADLPRVKYKKVTPVKFDGEPLSDMIIRDWF